MKQKLQLTPILMALGLLVSVSNVTAMMHYQSRDHIKYRIKKYRGYAYRKLEPYFAKAQVAYPPQNIALLIFKHSKRLELWAKDNRSWQHIKDYPILAASGGPGPKLLAQDRQVPEGVYRISLLNPDSHFHLSMQVNYPNAFDRFYARVDERQRLGGDIFIHGSNRSIGCIAIGDKAIDQLFVLAYLVGRKNIEVIIAPNDLRSQPPIYSKTHEPPPWLPKLYAKIKTALQRFHA